MTGPLVSVARKKRSGFRIPSSIAKEIKAMLEGSPLRPIRCTTSRRAMKRTRSGNGTFASHSTKPRTRPAHSKPHSGSVIQWAQIEVAEDDSLCRMLLEWLEDGATRTTLH
jgi:hypothetical protein